MGARAHAREHEDVRRADGAGAEDDLLAAGHTHAPSGEQQLHAHGARAGGIRRLLQHDAGDVRVAANGEVGARVADWVDVGARRRAARAVPNGELVVAYAAVPSGVVPDGVSGRGCG